MPTSPTISVQISAVDRVTATLDRVNAKMAKFTAPLQRAQASVQKFGQVSGLTRVGKAFGDISHSANEAFGKVSQIIAPLGAISGAASVAGMVRMVSAWADWGSKLGFSAQRIGITADTLQGLQGAARLAGSSAGGLTSGLQTLGQTMYDAIGGRAPEAAVMFRTLGVAFSDGAGHARSVTSVLPELADKIAALKDPYAQAQAATALFGGAAEDLLPFLRRGARGIAEYQEAAKQYGLTNQAGIRAANDLRMAQTGLSMSVEGLGNSVSQALAPVLVPILGQMSRWIAHNREWIASSIATEVQRLATWLKSINWADVSAGVHRFAHAAQHVVDMVGGWQPAIEGFIAFMGARWALGVLAPFASLASAILGVSGNLALLAGEGIGAVLTRLGLMKTAAGEAEAAVVAATAASGGGKIGSAAGAVASSVRAAEEAAASATGSTSLMRAAGAGLGLASRALPWAYGLYETETELPHALSWATGQGWNDETPRFQGPSPNQRGGYGGGVRRDPSAPSGRNAGPAAGHADMSLPRGIRNNNPLNLGYAPGQGAEGSDGRFGQYPTMADGIAAETRQLVHYQAQGADTIAKMIARWSPASENETGSYVRQVSQWTGIDPTARVDMHDPVTAQKIIGAMARRESGGVSANEVQMGVGLALGGVATGPALPPPVVASGPPAQLAGWGSAAQAGGGMDGSSLHVTVDVNHGNAPPGSTVRARVTAKGVDVAGAHVAQSNLTSTLP